MGWGEWVSGEERGGNTAYHSFEVENYDCDHNFIIRKSYRMSY